MGFLSDKPYTAITAHIERYTTEEYEEDDVAEVVELVDIIRIRGSVGATEAARAIRKRLKYGTTHRQIRALTILDALVENAGPELKSLYRDEFLLERLRLMLTEPGTNPRVKRRLENYVIGWANSLQNEKGCEGLVRLARHLPKKRTKRRDAGGDDRQHHSDHDVGPRDDYDDDGNDSHDHPYGRERSASNPARRYRAEDDDGREFTSSRRVRGEAGRDAGGSGSREASPAQTQTHKKSSSKSGRRALFSSLGGTSSSAGGSSSRPTADAKSINEAIAHATAAATNLTNALAIINPATELPSENEEASRYFNECRHLRRRVLRYLHNTESEKYMGPLIHANEELVAALQKYDAMCHEGEDGLDDWKVERNMQRLRVSDDSDSDYPASPPPSSPRTALKKAPPPISPKPAGLYKPRADPNNPFDDENAETL